MSLSKLRNLKEDSKFLREEKCVIVDELIGEGTFGYLRLVKHEEKEKRYAVKVIPLPEKASNVYLETDILRQVTHRNIVKFHKAVLVAKKYYIFFDFIKGRTLKQMLESRGPFTENESRRILFYVSSALLYLHEHDLSHRDIKSQNIMMNTRGTIKVLDVGLGCFEASKLHQTFCGTVDYLPPEIFYGEYVPIFVDFYATGILAYELTTGCLPFSFTGLNLIETVTMKTLKQYDTLPLQNRNVSAAVQNLINGLLEPYPSRRYDLSHVFDVCNNFQ